MKAVRSIVVVCVVGLFAITASAGSLCRAVDVPGSTWTQLWQINNLGQFLATSDSGSSVNSGGAWSLLAPPPGYAATDVSAIGINDSGAIVGGLYDNASQTQLGFMLQNGTYNFFTAPGAAYTLFRSITNSGVIFGTSDDGSGLSTGFRFDTTTGYSAVVPTLNGQNAFMVVPGAANASGTLVGSAYFSGAGPGTNGAWGFVYDPGTSTYSVFRINGKRTAARGINNAGVIAAMTYNPDGTTSAWIRDANGDHAIDCPNIVSASGFYAESINDAGVVTGGWLDGDGNPHGFVAYPDVTALLNDLQSSATGVGPGKSLAKKIADAKTDYAAGDIGATCGALADFIAEVNAQSGKSLGPSQAAALTAKATMIRQAVGCN